MAKRVGVIVALLLTAAWPVTFAQTLVGKAVQPSDGSPVAGVLVYLIDSTGNVSARAITNEHGEYRLRAPAGTYRVQTLRIGYHPAMLSSIDLSPGMTREQQLKLTSLPLSLDTLRVLAEARCAPFEGSLSLASVWEQARTALTATELTARNQMLHASVIRLRRALDPRSGRVEERSTARSSGFVTKPWGTLPRDSVRKFGYVYRLDDGSTTYHAPDIEALLSDDFLQHHCFRLASARDSNLLGVAFEPALKRKHLPEIAGTVWMDRKSAALRRMDFRYVNLKKSRDFTTVGNTTAGAAMDFVRMSNGGWAISNWEIRAPVFRPRYRHDRSPYQDAVAEIYVVEWRLEVGALELVTQGRDTLWRPSKKTGQ